MGSLGDNPLFRAVRSREWDPVHARIPARTASRDPAVPAAKAGDAVPAVLAIVLVIVPFAYSRATSDPFHALRWTLLAFGAAAVLAVLARRAAPFALPPSAGALLGGWLAASALSALPASDKAEAVWQAVRDTTWAAWFLALLAIARRCPGLPVRLRRAALPTAGIAAAAAIGQYWGLWWIGDGLGYGPGGLQGNRNLLASLLLLLVPWIAWGLAEERGAWRVAAWMAWSVSAYALVVAQCRAAWVGLAVSVMAAASLAAAFRPRPVLRIGALAGAAGIFCAAFLFHGFHRPAYDARIGSLERAESLADASDASAAQRLTLWAKTGRLIAAHPVRGVGGGNWKLAVLGQGLGGTLWPDMEQVETRPYNDWLWMASEIGIPGALCWAGLWAFALVRGWRAARRAGPGARAPAALLSAGLLGFAVLSALDFPRERAEHMAWLAAALAILIASPSGSARPRPVSRGIDPVGAWLSSRGAFAAFAAAALILACASLWRWRNEAVMTELLEAQARRDWAAMLDRGAGLDRRFCDLNPAGSPAAWHTGMAHWELGETAGAERDFRDALRLSPWHTHVLYDLSVARLAAGDTAETLALLRRALATSPGFAPASINLALLALRKGRPEEARLALDGVAEGRRDGNWRRVERSLAERERGMR